MARITRISTLVLLVASILPAATPGEISAQVGGSRRPVATPPDTLSADMRARIQDFYAAHPRAGAKRLPPGIRKNLQRGKPLPPGIARRGVPEELRTRLLIPEGYQVIEVGLDVLLVEVGTNIIHDVLMDVIGQDL